MKKLLLAVAAFLCLTVSANAQCNGVFGAGQVCGSLGGGPPTSIDASSVISSVKLPVTVAADTVQRPPIGFFTTKVSPAVLAVSVREPTHVPVVGSV